MNENKKVLIVIGIIIVFISLIGFGMFKSSMERQKIMKNFRDAYSAKQETLIYIGRPDCSACIRFQPTFETVIKKYKIDYVDINTDTLKESQLHSIIDDLDIEWDSFGTPTIAVVKENQVVKTSVGALSEESLITFLKDSNMIEE